jgi:putative hydrolase of the HAD superfamily
MVKTILFDYAGVITPVSNNFDFARKYSKRFSLTPKELMKMSYENWSETATGKLDCGSFWGQIASKLDINPVELRNLVVETFPVDKRMVELIEKTHFNYTTVLFSNQIEDWIEKVLEDNNLRNVFDYLINSYIVGARKPDKKIFNEAIRQTSTIPEEILFIDDSIENIEAAKKIGINTIHFENYDQFLKEYKKYVVIN